MDKKPIKTILLALGIIALLAIVFIAYTSDYYPADEGVLNNLSDLPVDIIETDRYIACLPQDEEVEVGYVFYPGGKVDEKAYLPYLTGVSENGYLCVVVKAPFKLAVLRPNAADSVKEDYSGINKWVVGGHSLGGVVAGNYVSKGKAQGLSLLASYPSADLSNLTVSTISIVADKDKVLNWDSYEEGKEKLPKNTEYLEIKGGNHSQFGAYGFQKGDGKATITQEEQRTQVINSTVEFLNEFKLIIKSSYLN